MALFRMIMKEAGGRFQNAAGSIGSNRNMYYGAKGCAPSDKLAGGIGGISGGTGLAFNNLMGGSNTGVDSSSIGEAASAMA